MVEDEESYREAPTSGLGRGASRSRVAADGMEALRLFTEHQRGHRPLGHPAAGDAGHRGLPDACGPCKRTVPSSHGQCRGRRVGRGPRLRAGGRGLRHQAVPPPGAGGPHARHPAEGVSRPDRRCPRTWPATRRRTGEFEDGSRPNSNFGSVTVDFVRREVHGGRDPGPICPGASSTCWRCYCPRPGGCAPGTSSSTSCGRTGSSRTAAPGHPHPPAPGLTGARSHRSALHRDRAGRGLPDRSGRHLQPEPSSITDIPEVDRLGDHWNRRPGRRPPPVSRTDHSRSQGSEDRMVR